MDIANLLKSVNCVDDYIFVTREIAEKCQNSKLQINITTVLALKKIRALEIEYLNKCYENGAASIVFGRLLSLPPSKTWGVLAKELVSLLQYWLEAIRKYLITHSVHWWSFLTLILKFIKEICLKAPTIPNILVELTAECLLDIATQDTPDVYQRHDILHCFNVFSADSSRDIRGAMRNNFGVYFTNLAALVSRCGYLPCQYVSMEALMRWLVRRMDPKCRAAAAELWFPEDLYPPSATEIFLNTGWMNFFQDARNFLNALNEAKGLVTSMVCRRLTIGNVVIISGSEKQQTWLDINSEGRSISVLLCPRALETFGLLDHRTCEILMLAEDNTETATLYSESQELTIKVNCSSVVRVHPSGIALGDASDVTIVVSSRVHLRKLDNALKAVFQDKYRLLISLYTELPLSPLRSRETRKNQSSSEEDTRFSHPAELKRRPRSGCVSTNRNAGLVSPSSASTSSLAQLHVKLAALPHLTYDKEPVSICAKPQLSSVTEISETDDRSSHSSSTVKIRHCGISDKKFRLPLEQPTKSTKQKAASDSETLKLKPKLRRRLSPIFSEEDSTSCLLVGTIGSANDSIINDTLERLGKSKQYENYDIVDLLVQEALEAKPITEGQIIDSGKKKIFENEENNDAIENTPIQNDAKKSCKNKRIHTKKICTVISKSTTEDESNTEAINETPIFVNQRKKILKRKSSVRDPVELPVANKHSFDVQTVDEFFTQHIAESKSGEILISPSLAKKINASSSDTSDNFNVNCLHINDDINTNKDYYEFNDIDIVECLNDMVDKVCNDFEKCTEYLKSNVVDSLLNKPPNILKEVNNENIITLQQSCSESKPKKNTKLTYKAKMEKKTIKKAGSKKNNTKIKKQETKKMSTIIERKNEEVLEANSPNRHTDNIEVVTEKRTPLAVNSLETPIRKKRKLYSPKDNEIEQELKGTKLSETDDEDTVLSEFKTDKSTNIPKVIATSYQDLERERQKRIRLPRSKKTRSKAVESPSPRTLKMDAVFEKLKSTVDENIILVSEPVQKGIYNFTSDSEDEDFVKKTMELRKRTSTTTIGSLESMNTTRKGRQRNRPFYYGKSSSDEVKNTKPAKRRRSSKKTNIKRKTNVNIECAVDLVDERMRQANTDILDCSISVEKPASKTPAVEVELTIHDPPKMDIIMDDPKTKITESKKGKKKLKKDDSLSLNKNKLDLGSEKEEDRTESPLPGLVVETIPSRKDNANDTFTATTLQQFKEIYKDHPHALNESYNTQNMLLYDLETCNDNPQNVTVNIIEQMCFEEHSKKRNKEIIHSESGTKKTRKNNRDINQQNKVCRGKNNIKTESTTYGNNRNEVMEISERTNDESIKSFATDGITAHGCLDEAPPSPEMLRKSMQPREIEDLNESMKDYYIKLNREIGNSSPKNRRESSTDQGEIYKNNLLVEKKLNFKSPVVSVERLSIDDISKWLPSRRTSDTDNSTKSSPHISKIAEKATFYEEPKSSHEILRETKLENIQIPTNVHTPKVQQLIIESKVLKTPLVSIATMAQEELNQWLPMPNRSILNDKSHTSTCSVQKETNQSSLKLVYDTRPKYSTRLADKTKSVNIHTTKPDSSNKRPTASKNATKNASVNSKGSSKVVSNRTNDSDDNRSVVFKDKSQTCSIRSLRNNMTVISPVKDFEDFVSISRNNSQDKCLPKNKNKHEELVKFATNNKSKKSIHDFEAVDSAPTKIDNTKSQDSRYSTKTKALNRLRSTPTIRAKEVDSTSTVVKDLVQIDSASTKMNHSIKSPMKKISSPLLGKPKKRRLEENVDIVTIDSAPSFPSVSDWLKKLTPSHSVVNTNLSVRETLQNITEKLDTTLVEINQNTSKKLINLIVDAQKQLTAKQAEQGQLKEVITKEILSEIAVIIERKFADLDKRSRQADKEFEETWKQQAFELVREDCRRKRAMVRLLKEDVEMVIDQIEKNRSESY